MKKNRPDLVDKCPNCGISFQQAPKRKKVNGRWGLYGGAPVMASEQYGRSALACMNCGIHEGQKIVQEGYREPGGFFKPSYVVPPVYSTETWVLRSGKPRKGAI